MKRLSKFLLSIVFFTGVLCLMCTENASAYTQDATAGNTNVATGGAIRLRSQYGSEVDGYHLNHEYVQVLNINTGNITIGDETFSQENGDTDFPWDTKTDAYVIRGKGNSANNITITATKKTTIYLMDLEWNGSIYYNQSNNIEFIICGKVVNRNNFLVPAAAGKQINTLTIKGHTPEAELNVLNGIFNAGTVKECSFNNVIVTAGRFDYYGTISNWVYVNNNIADTSLNITNATITLTTAADAGWGTNNFKVENSAVKNLAIFRQGVNGTIEIANSTMTDLRIYEYSGANIENLLKISNSTINNILSYGVITGVRNPSGSVARYPSTPINHLFKIVADHSVLRIGTSPIKALEADKCTIETVPNTVFTNIIADSCSLKGVFSGTPVDFRSNDLYPKIIRLRNYADQFVMVSFDGGEAVKLLTDLNGCLYPYVTAACRSIEITTEDGNKTQVTLTPCSTDDDVAEVDPGVSNGPIVEEPAFTEKSYIVSEWIRLEVIAQAKDPANNDSLTYQWFKNGVELADETFFDYNERTTAAGEYEFYCVVTDVDGTSTTSKTVTTLVTPRPNANAPTVVNQTSNMALVAGSDITLIVSGKAKAAGDTVSYQWYKDSTKIAGATLNKLDLKNLKKSDAGNYKCMVTDETSKLTSDSAIYKITIK